jgi:hypothetical protein
MENTTLSDQFDLPAIIRGLAADLQSRRAGLITIDDARVRAEMAKQLFAGLRLVISANKHLEQNMKSLPTPADGSEG